MKLKIFVNKKTNKVVFAEAGKEFVDFLAQIMSLSLSTVSKLLKEAEGGMLGCQGSLYDSMVSLGSDHYTGYSKEDKLLNNPASFVAVPLLSLRLAPTSITYYECRGHGYISDHKGVMCPGVAGDFDRCSSCNMYLSSPFSRKYVPPRVSEYVKQQPYIVMDNLEVKPMSVSLIKSFFDIYGSLEENEVKVGKDEGLAILKASLERQDVLTSVFLPIKIE